MTPTEDSGRGSSGTVTCQPALPLPLVRWSDLSGDRLEGPEADFVRERVVSDGSRC